MEHDASPDNIFVHDATFSIIKTDDNYSAMAKAAEAQNIIEKPAWGNESSMNCAGIQSLLSNATNITS